MLFNLPYYKTNIRSCHKFCYNIFIFARKGCNWCPCLSRERAIRSCETANMTFFSGQECVFQQDSFRAQKAKTIQE